MHRLFVALRPPIAVRRQLLEAMGDIAGAHWHDDAQLHITLRYIGKVERRTAEDIAASIASVRSRPITIAVSGVGVFEDHGRPSAVWAGVTPHGPITALHRAVDQAIVRTGREPEHRAYCPHITLARLGRDAGSTDRFMIGRAMLSSDPFTLDHMLLYESTIGHGGPTYDAIARFPLAR
ncbi:MAG: RNA 2',3'-cyclic phosphodiesterase [Pseudomonadota bacterium]